MATAALDKLRTLINELFLLDEPDLDFGLYRVMKARRAQVEQFRDHELNAVVTRTLSAHKDLDRDALQRELEETRASARKLGVTDDASVPRIQEILAQIAVAEKLSVVSDDVFSHLFAFFSRYYQSGDFHCRRQFRDGVYAIPYEGEEVKLFWANKDQYYIKTTQRHPQFEFQLVDGARVRFEVVGGSEERDNSKSSRVFMLDAKEPFVLEGVTLVVRFHYDVDPHGAAQDAHSQRVADELSKREALASWYVKLADIPAGETQSLLARRLRQFMRRETFDYFIHKDLRRFLRQELDTYLKTEMMWLDDIEHSSAPRVEEYLSKLRVTRTLGHTIIDFVAQLEDFQKRLWLKKKFVLGQSWLVSMALVPRALWPAVIANDRQREAWVKLCAIDKIERDLSVDGYSVPLTERFLEGNPSLPLDTSLFDEDFTAKLLDAIGDTDARTLGLLVNGENFQALQLLKERFANKIKCIYIDPPYNTGGDGFAYKDNYPHSSWLSMMEDRVRAGRELLAEDALLICSINDIEQPRARLVLDDIFGSECLIANCVWVTDGNVDNQKRIKGVHEYIIAYEATTGAAPRPPALDPSIGEASKLLNDEISNTIVKNGPKNPVAPINLPAGFPADFETGVIAPVSQIDKWPKFDDPIHVEHGKTTHAVTLRSGWSSSELLDDFIHNDFQAVADAKGQHTRFELRSTGAVYAVKVRDTDRSHVLSVIRSCGSVQSAAKTLNNLGLSFDYPKPLELISYVSRWRKAELGYWLDYFAGSGTTAHAVMELNAQDKGNRRFILVEAGEHFDTVLAPRVAKLMHAREWKDGVPVAREGTIGVVQVLRIESYDDTLDNLESALSTQKQELLFDSADAPTRFGREFMLRYMLDRTTDGSPSLLDAKALERPFDRKLRVSLGGVRACTVDVVETFHWLIGMTVTHRKRYAMPEIRVSRGTLPDEQRAVTIWRDVAKVSLEALHKWFTEELLPTLSDTDVVFVNGDENLRRFKPETHRWEVRHSHLEFSQRMFVTAE